MRENKRERGMCDRDKGGGGGMRENKRERGMCYRERGAR